MYLNRCEWPPMVISGPAVHTAAGMQSEADFCCDQEEAESALTSFASATYFAEREDTSIGPGQAIPFCCELALRSIGHVPCTSQFVVTFSGEYQVLYSVYYTSGKDASIALAVNTLPVVTTSVPLLAPAGMIGGSAILTLNEGDTVEIINASLTPIDIAVTPAAAAQISIFNLWCE